MPLKTMRKTPSRFRVSTDHALIASKHLVPSYFVPNLASSHYRLIRAFHHLFAGVSVAEQHYIILSLDICLMFEVSDILELRYTTNELNSLSLSAMGYLLSFVPGKSDTILTRGGLVLSS